MLKVDVRHSQPLKLSVYEYPNNFTVKISKLVITSCTCID